MTRTVLHVIDTWGPGGAETVCVEVARGLDPARWRSRGTVIREGWVYEAMQQRGLAPTIVPVGRGVIDVGYLLGLRRLAQREGATLLQTHLAEANLYGALAARLLGRPSVATFHGFQDFGGGGIKARLKLQLTARGASRLVFVSDALRREFLSRVSLDQDRTAVIHNGIDTQRFAPRRSDALRRELGLGPDAVLVGAVGNVREAKAYDTLLHTAALAVQADPRLWFVVAGRHRPPLSDELLALRARLGLDSRVHFLGFQEDPVAVVNGLDVYLSTSRSEGFSLTVVQAMACALPVIATRSGGPEEIVTDGVDGILVNVDDVPALARTVCGVAADAPLRERLGAAGRRTAVERFSLRRMVDAYAALYDELLNGR